MKGRRNSTRDVWRNVAKGAPDECWEWTGCRGPRGYGRMGFGGFVAYAHRVAFQDATGTNPGRLLVLHKCDNPPCCNPAHLRLGTNKDNMLDCAAKGRTTLGERHPQAKLNDQKVVEIRRRKATGETTSLLASEFGVSPRAVRLVAQRQTWRHVA